MKIVFFGSTNLALPVLKSLKQEHEIAAVITTPDAHAGRKREITETPVSALAKALGLKLLKPENLKSNQEFFLALRGLAADIFVVVAYGKILPMDIITLPKYGTLNVHPSLLPKYRGPSPIRTALQNGDSGTGVSFILLDQQVDHGPILGSQEVEIGPDDNDLNLTEKLAKAAAAKINQVIADYAAGKTAPAPQDELRATFTKLVNKSDGRINWQKNAQQIYNQFRAFYPWPGIWSVWNGKKIKITDCAIYNPNATGTAAEITQINTGFVLERGIVACGDNSKLKIKSLQPEGRNEMDIQSFLNGNKNFIGTTLE